MTNPQTTKTCQVCDALAEAMKSFPDIHDGRVSIEQLIEHLHEWEAQHWIALQRAHATLVNHHEN